MKEFSVYTKIGCPYCTKVVAALELAEQQFVEYKLGRDFTGSEFYEKFGKMVALFRREIVLHLNFYLDIRKK